jgi:hypothetical protein
MKEKIFFNLLLLAAVNIQAIGGYGMGYERLFPMSCYGQVIEICMRVIADRTHKFDPETAIDLYAGRLFRLAHAVGNMENRHKAKFCYPPEDIAYAIGLIGIVHRARQEDLRLSPTCLALMMSIEARLARLLHQR